MKIRHLTLIVTDECNFSCGYCYKSRRPCSMAPATAAAALALFRTRLARGFGIGFYGGEPLLEFPLIRTVIEGIDNSPGLARLRPRYSLTTNGSLLAPPILDFLEARRFRVTLSFDGPAQEVHRQPGGFAAASAALNDLLARPRIRLGVNAVFTPRTVPLLARSVRFLADAGVRDIRISTALNYRWTRPAVAEFGRRIREVRRREAAAIRRGAPAVAANFREGPGRRIRGLFACGAGRDRMAVTPEGEIWGCHLFPDLFRIRKRDPAVGAFRFGRLDDPAAFAGDEAAVRAWHGSLGLEAYTVAGRWCLFCPERESCAVCPLHAAFAGGPIAAIPPHVCAIQRLWIAEKKAFRRAREVANRRENR